MNRLKFTLKAWPVIAAATIGLCFLTQGVAKLFGIDLPDQQNIEVVRAWLTHAFDSTKHFMTCAFLLAQVLVLLPAIEEFVFRYLLFILPVRLLIRHLSVRLQKSTIPAYAIAVSVVIPSSALFSAAHYIAQPFPDDAFIALFFFGLAQCWLYSKTDRIWCPMLNHALFNLTNLILIFVVPEGREAASILTCGF